MVIGIFFGCDPANKAAETNNVINAVKQGIINFFVNSVYVYNDKLVISFYCKDGDKCITFDEIKEILGKRKPR